MSDATLQTAAPSLAPAPAHAAVLAPAVSSILTSARAPALASAPASAEAGASGGEAGSVGACIGRLEAELVRNCAPVECPVFHRFTPGLYIRETHMPAGAVVTSKIHRTEHPYVVSLGLVSVYSENDGVQHLRAPYTGITKPGTRRVLVIHEDTVWTTFHPTPHTDVAQIEAEIIEPHTIPSTLSEGENLCLGSQSE